MLPVSIITSDPRCVSVHLVTRSTTVCEGGVSTSADVLRRAKKTRAVWRRCHAPRLCVPTSSPHKLLENHGKQLAEKSPVRTTIFPPNMLSSSEEAAHSLHDLKRCLGCVGRFVPPQNLGVSHEVGGVRPHHDPLDASEEGMGTGSLKTGWTVQPVRERGKRKFR